MIMREIEICGRKIPFRSSATIPRLYRAKFKRDIFKDLSRLEKSYKGRTEEGESFQIEDLEIFENVAYVMAYHADHTIPADIDEWLDQFDMFSIYEVLPQILELWGENMATEVAAKKARAEVSGKCLAACRAEIHFVRRPEILSALIHAVREQIGKLPQKLTVDGTIEIAGGVVPCDAVVGDHLLLNIPRRQIAGQKFHRRLDTDLRSLHIACVKHLLQRGDGERFCVRIKYRFILEQRLKYFLTGRDHLFRRDIPEGLTLGVVQRDHGAPGPSLIQQLLPHRVRLYSQRDAGDHFAF